MPKPLPRRESAGRFESISRNTADGFAAALNAFIAQNYGAGKMDRVRKGYRASLWTVGIWGLLISFVFICFPKAIADIFFHEPKAVVTAVGYLVIIGFSEAFMCVEPDDRRRFVRTRQDKALQYHQHRFYQCKNSACNYIGRSDRSQWNLVGTFHNINHKRNHIYLYIFVDNEETRIKP